MVSYLIFRSSRLNLLVLQSLRRRSLVWLVVVAIGSNYYSSYIGAGRRYLCMLASGRQGAALEFGLAESSRGGCNADLLIISRRYAFRVAFYF